MPFTRDQYIDKIVYQLSVTRFEMASQNKLGRFNSNKTAEDFFCGLLNLIYGWNLVNANRDKENAPGIDLIDRENKVVVQVSSTADHGKIQKSLDKLDNYYDGVDGYHFYMMVITYKQGTYHDFNVQGGIIFNKDKDIWDIDSLIGVINGCDVDLLGDIYAYLKNETGIAGDLTRTSIRNNLSVFATEQLQKYPYLFISYCHKDRSRVIPILQQFDEAGIRYWYDDILDTGVNYPEEIEKAIDYCQGAVFFLTDNAVESAWCRSEIIDCCDQKPGQVYPVFIEKTQLKYGLRVKLKQIQYFDLTSSNGDASNLIEKLQKRIPEVFKPRKNASIDVITETDFKEQETLTIVSLNPRLEEEHLDKPTVKTEFQSSKKRTEWPFSILTIGINILKIIMIFGSYEQDSNNSNGFEEIEWIVLDVEDDQILLISKYGIDSKLYNESPGTITWENCTLRKWLNNDFLNIAFSEEERKNIYLTRLINDDNSDYNEDGGNSTEDYIFCLSLEEADRYFSSNNDRICYPTEYAVEQGVWSASNGACWWTLRTPGKSGCNVTDVNRCGGLSSMGLSINTSGGAVRPAMWIDISSQYSIY